MAEGGPKAEDTPEIHPPPQVPGQARLGRQVIVVSIAAVLIYSGLLFYSDLSTLPTDIGSAGLVAVAWALLLSVGNFVVRYLRWSYYLKRLGIHVPTQDSALVFLAGFSMALTPAKAGEVLKSIMLKEKHGVPIARSAPVLVTERVTDLASLVLLSAVGCLAFEHGVLIAGAGALMVAALMVVCAWRPPGDFVLGLLGRIRLFERVTPRLREAHVALWQLSGPTPSLVGLVLGTVAWGFQCLSLYVVADAWLKVGLTIEASLFIYAAPLLAGTVAMLPGGLGITEASMTMLMLELAQADITRAGATAVTLIVRLCALWWGVAIGLGALALWRMGGRSQPSLPVEQELSRSSQPS